MITLPWPTGNAYICRLAQDTGATLYAVGRTRQEAYRRLVAALESRFAEQYARDEALTARSIALEESACNTSH